MKLIRHLTTTGPAYAALTPDGSCLRLLGNPFSGAPLATAEPVIPGKLLSPVSPTCIHAIGLNYRKHAEEGGKGVPDRPMLFIKANSSVLAPDAPIEIPLTQPQTTQVDFEAELAVVIGRPAKNVKARDALDYVLGYTCANDVSARDWQRQWGGGQFCQAKSFDTFCPLGPVLVTADELLQPNSLRIRSVLNQTVMQDWTTADMVFDVPTLIECLSMGKTLLPGTVILTGTPHGVGFARTPPVYLRPGDTISIDIERIGTLSNPVIAAPGS